MVLKVYGQSNTKDTDCCSDTAVFLFHGIDFESPPPNKRQVSRDAKYTRRQAFPVRWYNFIGGRMQVYFEGIYQFNRATYPQTMPKKVDKRSWHNPAKRDTMCSSQTFPQPELTTDGTGIVHLAPAFGEDDSRVCHKYDIGFVQFVDAKGCMTDDTDWPGVFVKKADPKILKDLEEKGLLFAAPVFEHSYPHCWRCRYSTFILCLVKHGSFA